MMTFCRAKYREGQSVLMATLKKKHNKMENTVNTKVYPMNDIRKRKVCE